MLEGLEGGGEDEQGDEEEVDCAAAVDEVCDVPDGVPVSGWMLGS